MNGCARAQAIAEQVARCADSLCLAFARVRRELTIPAYTEKFRKKQKRSQNDADLAYLALRYLQDMILAALDCLLHRIDPFFDLGIPRALCYTNRRTQDPREVTACEGIRR